MQKRANNQRVGIFHTLIVLDERTITLFHRQRERGRARERKEKGPLCACVKYNRVTRFLTCDISGEICDLTVRAATANHFKFLSRTRGPLLHSTKTFPFKTQLHFFSLFNIFFLSFRSNGYFIQIPVYSKSAKKCWIKNDEIFREKLSQNRSND